VQPTQKLILTNFQAPGDILMLTAAVRDLHRCYPNRFLTDVRTSCPALWENNPYLTPLGSDDRDVTVVECHYPLVQVSNERPVHFLHGFIEYLNDQLELRIKPTIFGGDVHLSDSERAAPSLVEQLTGKNVPYWIIVAGGKYDFTIKWWHFRRWQAVVDHFREKILFVQIGKGDDYHPPLKNVLDFRNKTSLRDIVRLVYRAQGVVCPVTFLMHLTAAVEFSDPRLKARPCVVVAGGRESPHWEAYPTHQFIHTVGALPCCATAGCWRSRIVPLGDGDEKDRPEHLCLDVRKGLPRCMEMITPQQVCERIDYYFRGGQCEALKEDEMGGLAPGEV